MSELPAPFKALQMGYVWRADRRRREDTASSCSAILTYSENPQSCAKIELILATTTTLGRLGFKGFQIRINERRILKAMAAYSGFPERKI